MGYALCIDIGNSLTKYAVFDDHKIKFHQTTENLIPHELDAIFSRFEIKNIIISSVKNVNQPIKKYLTKKGHLIEMAADLKLPVRIKYTSPDTLGKDRLAAVCGSVRLYPHITNLVIGIGTCVTYDLLNHKHEYLGGNISPGLDMRLKAMHQFTAKLPLVEKNLSVSMIGTDTTSALQSGGLWGIRAEINGMIELYKGKYPGLNIVLSGGGADYFKKSLKKPIFAHPNLVLLGLNHILSLNV